ncbi:MAG TPA: hypothetical protein VFV05_23725 [Methylomirabilota bacterium]|nr:hypothetical protein [Methylomirabilota bacterium]
MKTWRATGMLIALPILISSLLGAVSAAAQDAPRQGGILKAVFLHFWNVGLAR